jgi:hypothetical protein
MAPQQALNVREQHEFEHAVGIGEGLMASATSKPYKRALGVRNGWRGVTASHLPLQGGRQGRVIIASAP